MKKLLVALTLIGLVFTSPANAWYRGGGYYGGGWNRPYYGGYGYGYRPYYGGGYGAALGVAAGAAILGGVLGGAIASQPYYGYSQCPSYDAWGNFVGYTYC